MIQKKRTLRHFGLENKGTYRGARHDLFVADIIDAIDENQVAALIGQFGCGKSTVARFAIGDLARKDDSKYRFVYIDTADLERLSAGQILDAIIMDLSNESRRRSVLARSRQARRIMGELARNGKKICLVIDNAHRLHPNVLMTMKDEHEKQYLGYSPLFSVLYIGQEKLKSKLDTYKEVFWRTLILDLDDQASGWMTYRERVNYLEAVYGPAITSTARERIAYVAAKPLKMEYYITEKMEEARTAGKTQLDEDVVELTLEERKAAISVSYQEVADEAGIGKSTAHEAMHVPNHNKRPDVEAAIARLEEKRSPETITKTG